MYEKSSAGVTSITHAVMTHTSTKIASMPCAACPMSRVQSKMAFDFNTLCLSPHHTASTFHRAMRQATRLGSLSTRSLRCVLWPVGPDSLCVSEHGVAVPEVSDGDELQHVYVLTWERSRGTCSASPRQARDVSRDVSRDVCCTLTAALIRFPRLTIGRVRRASVWVFTQMTRRQNFDATSGTDCTVLLCSPLGMLNLILYLYITILTPASTKSAWVKNLSFCLEGLWYVASTPPPHQGPASLSGRRALDAPSVERP